MNLKKVNKKYTSLKEKKSLKVKESYNNTNPLLESLMELWDNKEDERWNNY